MQTKIITLIIAGLMLVPTIGVNAQEQPPVETKLNPQLASCLEQKMGSAVFSEIKTGTRKPTETEKKVGEECLIVAEQAAK